MFHGLAGTTSIDSRTRHAFGVRLLVFSILAGAVGTCRAQSPVMPDGFVDDLVLEVGDSPATMKFAPDGRLFVGRRIRGELMVGTYDATADRWVLDPQPFFTFPVPSERHRSSGLRDIAFDPDFQNNGWVYAFFMQDSPRHNRVVRIRAGADPDRADPGSMEVLIDLPFNGGQSSGSHNGGAMVFGSDGKLYIATGDGWNGGDGVQSLSTYTGKLFRLDPDGSIPADNPFYGTASGDLRGIWCLGLRNPFSMSVHPVDGRIVLNETRGNRKADHFLAIAGGNLGHQGQSDIGTPVDVWTNSSAGGSQLNAGGAFYVNPFPFPVPMNFPSEYHGDYFVAHWGSNGPGQGAIVRVRDADPATPEVFAPGIRIGGSDGGALRPVLTRVGPDGALWYLATDYELGQGQVRRIRYEDDLDQLAAPTVDPPGGTFVIAPAVAVAHPARDAQLRYTLDGSSPTSTSPVVTGPVQIPAQVSTTLSVRAFREGSTPSAVLTARYDLVASNAPPVALAGPDLIRAIGQVVTLNGSASFDPDGDDAALTDTWTQIGGPLLSDFDGEDFLSYFTPVEVGTYRFRLSVGDGLDTSTDEMAVLVTECVDEVSSGLAARWAFDETGEDVDRPWVLDSSDGASHGSLVGAERFAFGPVGGGLSVSFDGQDDRIELGTSVDASGESWSFTAFVRFLGFGVPDARLFSRADGVREQDHDLMVSTIRSGGQHVLRFRIRTADRTETLIATGSPLRVGPWIHVAATYDGQQMRLFQDGVLVASMPKSGSLTTRPGFPSAIGNQPTGAGSRPLHALLDEVRVYSRALQPEDLFSLIENPPGLPPATCECADTILSGSLGGPTLSLCRRSRGRGVLTIEGSRPNASGVLIIGTASNPTPFLDGLLAPVPWISAVLWTSDGLGKVSFESLRLPDTGQLVYQAIASDPSRVGGLVLTNAVVVSFPWD